MIKIAAAVLFSAGPAFALDTTTGTTIDFAVVLNPLLQLIAGLISVSIVPAGLWLLNWIRLKSHREQIRLDADLQAKLDALAQKFIGGAFSKVGVAPGALTIEIKNRILAQAAGDLAAAASHTLTALGSTDNLADARKVVENRLGMMAVAEAGKDIPNPSTQPPAAPTTPVVAAVTEPLKPVAIGPAPPPMTEKRMR